MGVEYAKYWFICSSMAKLLAARSVKNKSVFDRAAEVRKKTPPEARAEVAK
jgi:hypothetical protein